MTWTALIVGALAGLTAGWRAGRLHQHAHHRYAAWRGAVSAVPIAYRGAVEAVKEAIKYIAILVLVGAILLLIIWKANR